MKKIIALFAILSVSVMSYAQSKIVGRIDNDGNLILTATQQDCTDKLKAAGSRKSSEKITVSEVSLTQLNKGEVCLTGYEKDPSGKIIKGVRVECTTDDERNLIITPTSRVETISGRAFPAPAVVLSN